MHKPHGLLLYTAGLNQEVNYDRITFLGEPFLQSLQHGTNCDITGMLSNVLDILSWQA